MLSFILFEFLVDLHGLISNEVQVVLMCIRVCVEAKP